jgi:cytoskeletal protein CcmA (bactofilin family)
MMPSANPNEPTGDDPARGAVVGRATRITGRVDGGQDLRVHGRVEGTIRLSETLYVEPEGEVVADVEVEVAVVAGKVRGNIQATESVRLTETARMVGDIAAPRVVLVEGAAFRGRIDMGEFETAEPSGAGQGADRGAAGAAKERRTGLGGRARSW